MNIQEYLILRESFISGGEVITGFIAVFSIVLLFLTLISLKKKSLRAFADMMDKLLIAVVLTGFLLIIYFHVGISKNIYLTVQGLDTIRFYVPPWIESEKLYFWLVIISIIKLLSHPGNDRHLDGSRLILALFGLLTVAVSNPFSDPLPQFHREVMTWGLVQGSAHELQYLTYLISKAEYFYNSTYMWIHPPALFISYAFFTISLPGFAGMIFRKKIDDIKIVYRYIRPGYLFLTAGLILGYPWAVEAWRGAWWWDPKITGSLVMWAFYTAILHTMIYRRRLYTITGVVGIISFIFLVYTYLLTYIGVGVHAYG